MLSRRTSLIMLASAMLVPSVAASHNNPSFDKAVLAEILVDPAPSGDGANSDAFTLELPPKTIQLHYEVISGAGIDERELIQFAVASDGKQLIPDLHHEARSRPIKSGQLTIADVSGATEPFTIRILAEFIVKKSD